MSEDLKLVPIPIVHRPKTLKGIDADTLYALYRGAPNSPLLEELELALHYSDSFIGRQVFQSYCDQLGPDFSNSLLEFLGKRTHAWIRPGVQQIIREYYDWNNFKGNVVSENNILVEPDINLYHDDPHNPKKIIIETNIKKDRRYVFDYNDHIFGDTDWYKVGRMADEYIRKLAEQLGFPPFIRIKTLYSGSCQVIIDLDYRKESRPQLFADTFYLLLMAQPELKNILK